MSKTIKLLLSGTGLLLAILLVTPLVMADLSDVRQALSAPTQTDAGFPAIAVSPDGNKIGVVWVERYGTGTAFEGPIHFRGGVISTSTQGAFSDRITLDPAFVVTDRSTTPDIASDGDGKMHAVWLNLQDGGLTDPDVTRLYYASCTIPAADTAGCDANGDHSPIDEQTEPNAVRPNPVIAANTEGAGATHIVWVRAEDSDQKLYYSGSSDGSFSQEVEIDTNTDEASHPAIATAYSNGSNYVHLVWINGQQVRYARGDDTGDAGAVVNSWTNIPIKTLPTPSPTPSGSTINPGHPAVVAFGKTVVVMWEVFAGDQSAYNNSSTDEYYAVMAVSYDNGATFTALGSNAVGIKSLDTTYHRRLSDNSTGESDSDPNSVRNTIHAKGLQLSAAMGMDSTADVSGTVHLVWHQSYDPDPPDPDHGGGGSEDLHHDLFYSVYKNVAEAPNVSYAWRPDDPDPADPDWYYREFEYNETDGVNDPGKEINDRAYSTAPDIAVGPDGEVHLVYMEGNVAGGANGAGYRIDETIFTVYYNNNFGVAMSTPDVVNNNVYMPVILKNAR